MADFDNFATSLLEEAKCFLEKARKEGDTEALGAYLHSALLLGFCSLEAHLNAIAEDFVARPELSVHERSVLLEKEVRLENGEFVLGGLRMYRMDDRIAFLHRRFSGEPINKGAIWWPALMGAIDLRNKLVHPKQPHGGTLPDVERAIKSIVDAIDALYQAIYGRKFPAANLGLQSKMSF